MLKALATNFLKRYFALSCLLMASPSLYAQENCINDSIAPCDSITATADSIAEMRRLVIDSVANGYHDKFNAMSRRFKRWKSSSEDLLNNPYYFYLFASPTLYNATIHRQIGTLSNRATRGGFTPNYQVGKSELVNSIDDALSYVYTHQPELIVNNEGDMAQNEGLRQDVNVEVAPQVKLTDKASKEDKSARTDANEEWDIDVHKPNFWKFKADLALQFMQNYVSDNWYRGGENHNSLKSEVTLEANYDNKQKLIFTNKLEMRLGFQTSEGDTKHKYRSNSDLLRLTNKLGLQATKHWYYTVTLQTWTQFYPGYKKNDPKVYSDFMSPLESLISVGMDYKLNVKNFTLNASISPFAGKFKYVARDALTASYGLKDGKHANLEYGSNITVTYNWNICKNVSWNGRIYYFTDYSKAQIEWENTFNLKINKFLSAKLFLYPRFDDSVVQNGDDSYFQFNETLSVGFNYSF